MQKKGDCVEVGCDRQAERRGLCTMHYQRRKRSDPSFIKQIRGNDYLRFWSYVQKGDLDSCWEWTGQLCKGYGEMRISRKKVLAHRYSFQLANGYMPQNLVIHSCDNPPCVNPRHLREGTAAENSADMTKRSRQAARANNGKAKLTDTQVQDIHKCYERGMTQVAIGKRFGVSQATVSSVLLGKAWGQASKQSGGKRNWQHRPVGANNPNAKLTERQRNDIRDRYLKGEDARTLAEEFGVAASTVYRIKS